MKAKFFRLSTLCATILALIGCVGLEPYVINAPEDLAEKIAEYQKEKEGEKVLPDGAEEIDITTKVVGSAGNDDGWWTSFSQYFTIPAAKKVVLQFENYGTGTENYHNWNLCISTPVARDSEGYAEYFALRADNYGWGGTQDASIGTDVFSLDRIVLDIDGKKTSDSGWSWEVFRQKMNGAKVVMTLDHASEGTVYVNTVATATDGSVITETYNHPVSFKNDINAFLIVDHSHLNMSLAYIAPSDYPVIPDSEPVSISITGYPTAIAFDAEEKDFWGNATAKVTFADNSTMTVDKKDLNIILPDVSTPGLKTVVVTYSKTKKGSVATQAAGGAYTVELVASLSSVAVATPPACTTYYYLNNTALTFQTYGFALEATFGGSTKVTVALNDPALTVSPIALTPGAQDITFSYKPGSETKTCTQAITLVKGSEDVGLPDLSSDFLSDQSSLVNVPAGESRSIDFASYSAGAEYYHSPSVILRKADIGTGAEYALCRLDNFGWLNGDFANQKIADSDKSSDWDWTLLKSMINYSLYHLTVTNNGSDGNGGVKIRLDVTWPNGDKHFQEYTIRPSDYSDVCFCVSVEKCYLVIK